MLSLDELWQRIEEAYINMLEEHIQRLFIQSRYEYQTLLTAMIDNLIDSLHKHWFSHGKQLGGDCIFNSFTVVLYGVFLQSLMIDGYVRRW